MIKMHLLHLVFQGILKYSKTEYEFLSKYNSGKKYSKFIMSEAGLYKNKDYYCSKFKLDAYFFDFQKREYQSCKNKK